MPSIKNPSNEQMTAEKQARSNNGEVKNRRAEERGADKNRIEETKWCFLMVRNREGSRVVRAF